MTSLSLQSFYERVCEDLPKPGESEKSIEDHVTIQKKKVPFLNEPWVVKKCCGYLVQKGLDSEGLFRVPGSAVTIKKLAKSFNMGINPNFSYESVLVEDVAGVLKQYLRELNDPILCGAKSGDEMESEFLALLDLNEGSAEQVTGMKQLVEALSYAKKMVLYDLFYLFSLVVENERVNKMSSENLATIFGGMTNIFVSNCSPSRRTTLVRVMIEYFDYIFCDLVALKWDTADFVAKDTKKWLRVYLLDGTFKSFQCSESDTASFIEKKVVEKIVNSTGIEPSNYSLYQVQDIFYRRINPEECVFALVNGGSAILFTDGLEGELTELPVDRTKKSYRAFTDQATEQLSSVSEDRVLSVSSFNADLLKKEVVENFPFRFSIWVIERVPRDSRMAIDWDINGAVEGCIVLKLDPICMELVFGRRRMVFSIEGIVPMNDTTRFFLLFNSNEHVGIGFERREESFKFKEYVIKMRYCMKCGEGGVVEGEGAVESLVASEKEEGGDGRSSEEGDWMIIRSIQGGFVDDTMGCRVVVDFGRDEDLDKLVRLWRKVSISIKSMRLQVQLLAILVSNAMGGVELSSYSMPSLEDRFKEFISLAGEGGEFFLGAIKCGTGYYRCLLFKVLADIVDWKTMVLRPSRDSLESHMGVFLDSFNLSIVDLVNDPGCTYESESPKTKEIISKFQLRIEDRSTDNQCTD